MLIFSVRRGSAVIGKPDSIFGFPIEPGDLLIPPVAGGVSPFRASSSRPRTSARDGALGHRRMFGDDSSARRRRGDRIRLQRQRRRGLGRHRDGRLVDSNMNGIPDECEGDVAVICRCPALSAPCDNPDPSAGCANSTGNGGLLAASGSTSLAAANLVLVASNLPTSKTGLFYMGTQPAFATVRGRTALRRRADLRYSALSTGSSERSRSARHLRAELSRASPPRAASAPAAPGASRPGSAIPAARVDQDPT
jgi:hypothetical protein